MEDNFANEIMMLQTGKVLLLRKEKTFIRWLKLTKLMPIINGNLGGIYG